MSPSDHGKSNKVEKIVDQGVVDVDEEEDTHHTFHSPLNSNAIVTLTIMDPAIHFHHFQHFLNKFHYEHILPSSNDHIKLKFIDKADAQKLISELNANYSKDQLKIDLKFDELTHPGNIYVRGLTTELNNQDLFEIFKPFGEISSCKIVMNEFGQSKGYGFVNFVDGRSADDAIAKLNGLLINGSTLYLNHHISKKERIERIDFEKLNFTNLYIKNLPNWFNEDELMKLFGKFGEVNSIFLPEVSPMQSSSSSSANSTSAGADNNSSDQLSTERRFGFVNYKKHESAVQAILNLDSKELEPNVFLSVSRAQRRDERNKSLPLSALSHRSHSSSQGILSPTSTHAASNQVTPPQLNIPMPLPMSMHHQGSVLSLSMSSSSSSNNNSPSPINNNHSGSMYYPIPGPNQQQSNLYIKNLSFNITDERLHDAFVKFGPIISAKIMTNEQGQPRGFGFVCFKNLSDASNAMLNMNGMELDGEILTVSFANRNNKRVKNDNHHANHNHNHNQNQNQNQNHNLGGSTGGTPIAGPYQYFFNNPGYSNNNLNTPPPPPPPQGYYYPQQVPIGVPMQVPMQIPPGGYFQGPVGYGNNDFRGYRSSSSSSAVAVNGQQIEVNATKNNVGVEKDDAYVMLSSELSRLELKDDEKIDKIVEELILPKFRDGSDSSNGSEISGLDDDMKDEIKAEIKSDLHQILKSIVSKNYEEKKKELKGEGEREADLHHSIYLDLINDLSNDDVLLNKILDELKK